jgi:hypothetical protein
MPTPATHVYVPSCARVVFLDGFVPYARGSTPPAAPTLAWPAKDPADILDYQFNIFPAAAGNEGDSIATLDVGISPNATGDLELMQATANGLSAVLWLQGGQAGTTYSVTVAIGTTSGRTLQRTISLPCVALSSTISPPDALQTSGGTPLLDEDGDPLLAF